MIDCWLVKIFSDSSALRAPITRWSGRTAVGLLFILGLLLGACSARESAAGNDTGVTVQADAAATAVGETTLTIILTEAGGAPQEGAAVQVRGDMSHAGMVPVLRTAVEEQPGLYRAPFTWTMGGDWVVTITFVLADGRSGTETFPFTITN